MGCSSSCYIVQRITSAFKFVLQKCEVDCQNLDDLGGANVPRLAMEAFEKMDKLLKELRVEESVSKACGPSTRMLFLRIVVDTIKMALDLNEMRLQGLMNLLQALGNKSHASLW